MLSSNDAPSLHGGATKPYTLNSGTHWRQENFAQDLKKDREEEGNHAWQLCLMPFLLCLSSLSSLDKFCCDSEYQQLSVSISGV